MPGDGGLKERCVSVLLLWVSGWGGGAIAKGDDGPPTKRERVGGKPKQVTLSINDYGGMIITMRRGDLPVKSCGNERKQQTRRDITSHSGPSGRMAEGKNLKITLHGGKEQCWGGRGGGG